jgi:hypothetical protein
MYRRIVVSIANVVFVFGMAVFGFVDTGHATTLSESSINFVGWYGTGTNQTALVIDFSGVAGAGSSFAFGLNYGTASSGSTTVFNLMSGIAQYNPNFTFTYTTDPTYGHEIDSISYATSSAAYSFDQTESFNNFWSLSTSSNAGKSWDVSYYGVDTTAASNDTIAGLAIGSYGYSDTTGWIISNATPVTPTTAAAVPEPSSFVLLIAGGLAALAWSRRRKRA